MNFIEELTWRGLLSQAIPGTEEYLNTHKVAGYLGVDPTADSMHIGNLVSVMLLVHLQRAGHKPYALVGGATGMVGDPSGKDKERQLLSEEQIHYNASCIREQLTHFLDFGPVSNSAQMVNNYDWFKDFSFLGFLRDVGKHITINYMMSKDSVKKRLQGDSGISYTEFAYQLLQGYDFYHLYKNHGVKIQVGGSDQWGNITTGTELIRRMLGSEEKAFAAVCPLLTAADGSKLGKTAGGDNIWLSAERTSPYQFYQYWIQAADTEAEKYIRIFTLKNQEEIEAIIAEHAKAPHLRQLHKALADDVTRRVHGEAGLAAAAKLTDFLFGKSGDNREALSSLSRTEWADVAKASETKTLPKSRLENGMGILDLLVELEIAQSKGEARRSIEKDKSVRVNLELCESPEQNIGTEDLFFGTFLHLQKGKKNKYIVELV
ncbi:MAG: tyrosine--tRNA ligase [Bacteroidia bacterium]|nr:tyrosine--tRNA ligase [Bacteroidia bacterium]